jgi:hypothetical protein
MTALARTAVLAAALCVAQAHVVRRSGGPLQTRATSPAASSNRPDDLAGDDGFHATSLVTKSLISGLTSIVNAFGGVPAATPRTRPPDLAAVAPGTLLDGLRADYVERNYLWTGDIDPNLYDEECVFTDPTLSFRGLATFQRNIENLQPILSRLVQRPKVDLYSCELDEQAQQVRATWRMRGDIALPWRPGIDLRGRTTFTFDPEGEARGRVVDYEEVWELKAGEALMQLLRPAPWRLEP